MTLFTSSKTKFLIAIILISGFSTNLVFANTFTQTMKPAMPSNIPPFSPEELSFVEGFSTFIPSNISPILPTELSFSSGTSPDKTTSMINPDTPVSLLGVETASPPSNISEPTSTPLTGISTQLELDTDGDGVPDNMDQCPGFDDNLDADNDGIPDACDPDTKITTNTVATDTTLGGDLTVDGASFTIPSGITVEFDFVNNKIIIKNPNGKILIEFGGKITS